MTRSARAHRSALIHLGTTRGTFSYQAALCRRAPGFLGECGLVMPKDVSQ